MTARFVRRLLARVLPACGRHRGRRRRTVPEAAVVAAAPRRAPRPLPSHRSPYAREVAEARPLMDEPSPVRPYLAHGTGGVAGRWVLDVALRGFSGGPPAVIHRVYVRVGGGSRVRRSAVA